VRIKIYHKIQESARL